jgi:hypothetical protein
MCGTSKLWKHMSKNSVLVKGKAILDRLWGLQEVEVPRFQDNRHMKVVRSSTLGTGRLCPPRSIPGTHFLQRLSRSQGHSVARRTMLMKNSSESIGNRTREHTSSREWSQPTGPPPVSTSRTQIKRLKRSHTEDGLIATVQDLNSSCCCGRCLTY